MSQNLNSRALARLNSGENSHLGLFTSNDSQQIAPGSPLLAKSFWETFGSQILVNTPGNPLLGQYLQKIQETGKPICSGEEFNEALLHCISDNQGAVSDADLIAAAKALKLDTSQ